MSEDLRDFLDLVNDWDEAFAEQLDHLQGDIGRKLTDREIKQIRGRALRELERSSADSVIPDVEAAYKAVYKDGEPNMNRSADRCKYMAERLADQERAERAIEINPDHLPVPDEWQGADFDGRREALEAKIGRKLTRQETARVFNQTLEAAQELPELNSDGPDVEHAFNVAGEKYDLNSDQGRQAYLRERWRELSEEEPAA